MRWLRQREKVKSPDPGLLEGAMVDYMPEDNKREQAEAIKGFYLHFFIYVVVIAALFVINLLTGNQLWAQWPALGWGLGIIGHFYAVFVALPRRLKKEARQHRQPSDRTDNPHPERSEIV